MNHRFQLVLVLSLTALAALATSGPFGLTPSARAQESDRSQEGESRDERRDRFRRSFGSGSDRGSDFRGRSRGDDRPREEGSSGSSSSSPSSAAPAPSTSSTSSSSSLKMAEYVKGLVKQYDKNGNMMLDADERKDLRGRAAEADLNKDNVITVDELVAHLSGGASAGPASTSTNAPGSSSSSSTSSRSGGDSSGDRDRDRDRSGGFDFRRRDGDSSRSDRSKSDDTAKRVLFGSAGGSSKEGDKRHSYRFKSAAELLPKSLPSFFSRDKNGNGQVEMNEFSTSWSKSTVAEFQKLDKDGDGVITAKEAAAKP